MEVVNFEKDVIEESKKRPVLLDFWAEWCGPCRSLGPILEKLEAEAKGAWVLAKVNVDEHPQLAGAFGIQGIPFVCLFHEGQILGQFNSALPEPEVRKWLEQFLPAAEVVEGDLDLAKNLLDQNRMDEARQVLSQLVNEDKEPGEAQLLLAKSFLFENAKESAELLQPLREKAAKLDPAEKLGWLVDRLLEQGADISSDHPSATYYREALAQLGNGEFEQALDQFLEVLYRDKEYRDGAARKAIIGLFEYLGRTHPIVKAYERRFEMAMF